MSHDSPQSPLSAVEGHTSRADRVRSFFRKPWTKRILTLITFLLAAFGAAVWIQSLAVSIDESLSGRNEFVTRCAAAGNRVYKFEGEWVCVKDDPVSATKVGGFGEPSVEQASGACLSNGQLPVFRVDTEDWVYCVAGSIIETMP